MTVGLVPSIKRWLCFLHTHPLGLRNSHIRQNKGESLAGLFCQSHLFWKLLATNWEQGTKDEHFLPPLISLSILFSYQNSA